MWPIISLYQTMQNRSKASKLYVSNHSGLRLWSDDIFFDEIFFWTEILIWNNISEDFDGFQKSRPKDVSIISEIYYITLSAIYFQCCTWYFKWSYICTRQNISCTIIWLVKAILLLEETANRSLYEEQTL